MRDLPRAESEGMRIVFAGRDSANPRKLVLLAARRRGLEADRIAFGEARLGLCRRHGKGNLRDHKRHERGDLLDDRRGEVDDSRGKLAATALNVDEILLKVRSCEHALRGNSPLPV